MTNVSADKKPQDTNRLRGALWVVPVTLLAGVAVIYLSFWLTNSANIAIAFFATIVVAGLSFVGYNIVRFGRLMKRRDELTKLVVALNSKLENKTGNEPNRNWRQAKKKLEAALKAVAEVNPKFTRQCVNGLKGIDQHVTAGQYARAAQVAEQLQKYATEHRNEQFDLLQVRDALATAPNNRAYRRQQAALLRGTSKKRQ